MNTLFVKNLSLSDEEKNSYNMASVSKCY